MNTIRAYFDRIDRLEEEIKAGNTDKAEVYAEAKSEGFDVKALKLAFRRFKRQSSEPGALKNEDSLVDTYLNALTGTGIATRVHAREAIPHNPIPHNPIPHNPITGELHEPAGPVLPQPEQQAGAVIPHDHAAAPAAPTESDGGAFGAVKAQSRLPDAVGVEPPPSDEFPDLPEFLRRNRVAA